MSVWQTSRSCHLWFGFPVSFPLTPYLTTYIGVEGMKSLLASFFFNLRVMPGGKIMEMTFSPLSNSQEPWTFLLLFSHQVMSDSFVTPMDCSPPGSSVRGISQAKIWEWVAISPFCGSSWPRGSNLHLLNWQWDSLPLSHWGSPLSALKAVGWFLPVLNSIFLMSQVHSPLII